MIIYKGSGHMTSGCVTVHDTMTQWNGQASQDRSGGKVVIYAPDEIWIENTFDLHSDPATKKKKLLKIALAAQQAYQSKCAPGFVDCFNTGCH